MKPHFAFATIVMLMVAGFARAGDKVVTERIKVRNQPPSVILQMLYSEPSHPLIQQRTGVNSVALAESRTARFLPAGVVEISPRDSENILIARGSSQGLAELREIISMLDIKPRILRYELEIVRFTMNEKDGPKTETIGRPSLIAFNNITVRAAMRGGSVDYEIEARGHFNADESISLMLAFHLLKDSTAFSGVDLRNMRIPSRSRRLINRLTTSRDNQVLEQVAQGETPTAPGAYSAYFVYVTATREAEKGR